MPWNSSRRTIRPPPNWWNSGSSAASPSSKLRKSWAFPNVRANGCGLMPGRGCSMSSNGNSVQLANPMAGAEREIFWTARECATPAERIAYLDASCQGQAELRRRVEGLLRAEATAGGFLDEPDAPDGERPGTRIHEYVLQERIGEGGFGT